MTNWFRPIVAYPLLKVSSQYRQTWLYSHRFIQVMCEYKAFLTGLDNMPVPELVSKGQIKIATAYH